VNRDALFNYRIMLHATKWSAYIRGLEGRLANVRRHRHGDLLGHTKHPINLGNSEPMKNLFERGSVTGKTITNSVRLTSGIKA
jgi:hypothetical protein